MGVETLHEGKRGKNEECKFFKRAGGTQQKFRWHVGERTTVTAQPHRYGVSELAFNSGCAACYSVSRADVYS
jgi:hypothetical protein